MTAMPNRQSRLDFRLLSEHKELIERAAQAQGQTVTQFAIAALLKAARESIEQAETTELSDRDRDIFLGMLDAESEPNEALRRAAERYRANRD